MSLYVYGISLHSRYVVSKVVAQDVPSCRLNSGQFKVPSFSSTGSIYCSEGFRASIGER